MPLVYAAGVIACLLILNHLRRDHERSVRRRQERCAHRPEAQQTLRVSSTHPLIGYRTGARWLVKHCRDCGLQTHRYRRLQDWDEYQAEYAQETRDREREYAARKAAHQAEELARRKRASGGDTTAL